MKKKTYNNVLKGARILMKKGYEKKEAAELSLKIFEEHESGPLPVEHYLERVLSKEEWLKEYENGSRKKEDCFLGRINCTNLSCEFQTDGRCLYGGTAEISPDPKEEGDCSAFEPREEDPNEFCRSKEEKR